MQSNLLAQSSDVLCPNNLYQGCSISPDGLCVLTSTTGDYKLRLYNIPHSSFNEKTHAEIDTVEDWKTALSAQGGDAVRSYCWYPHMNSTDPATCCFLATCRDQPIHLFDAYSGAIRASYRPYNALDEMESPTVVQFSPNGQCILAGGFRTDRCVHVFDVSRPGRDSTVLRLGKTRRSSDGQKGLVSAIAGASDGRIFSIGTYSPGSIYIYDNRTSEQPSGTVLQGVCVVGHGRSHSRKKRRFANMEDTAADDTLSLFTQGRIKWFQSRAQGGLTQLRFSHATEYLLYSASRRSDYILSWDLRMLSGNPDFQSRPISGIRSFARISNTKQRLEFDLDDEANRLLVGGLDRCVKYYDTETGDLLGTIDGCFNDAVNGVSFHRFSSKYGVLAASCGSRRFPSEEDLENDLITCMPTAPGRLRLFRIGTPVAEN